MDYNRLSSLDLAALLASADSTTLKKVEDNEGFDAAQKELIQSTQDFIAAAQRMERAERTMMIVVRQFFQRKQVEESKWTP